MDSTFFPFYLVRILIHDQFYFPISFLLTLNRSKPNP